MKLCKLLLLATLVIPTVTTAAPYYVDFEGVLPTNTWLSGNPQKWNGIDFSQVTDISTQFGTYTDDYETPLNSNGTTRMGVFDYNTTTADILFMERWDADPFILNRFDVASTFENEGPAVQSLRLDVETVFGLTYTHLFDVTRDWATIEMPVYDLNTMLSVTMYTLGSNQYGFAIDNLAFDEVATVPVPAAVWLFGSGLLGLVGLARRKTSK